MANPTSAQLEGRFWAKVHKSPGCWTWVGAVDRKGYGKLHVARTPERRKILKQAHRMSWEINRGPIPPGRCVLHHCDNPPCVNPAHLYVGTKSDNTNDAFRRRRHPRICQVSSGDIIAMRRIVACGCTPWCHLARKYGVSEKTIKGISGGQEWRGVPRETAAGTLPHPCRGNRHRALPMPTRAAKKLNLGSVATYRLKGQSFAWIADHYGIPEWAAREAHRRAMDAPSRERSRWYRRYLAWRARDCGHRVQADGAEFRR